MKKIVITGELAKSHVAGYTKKDGTFVKEHDDKRVAAKPDSKMVDHFSAAGHRHISPDEFDAIRQKHAEAAKKNKHGNFANANHSGLLDENYRAIGATDSAGSKNSAYVTSQTYSHASHDLPAVTSVYNRKTGERHHFVKDQPAAAGKKVMVDKTLAKSHVSAFTRKDGTFVKEHEDGRTAAAPAMAKPRAKAKPKAPAFDHPNVVGHAVDHKVLSGGSEVAGNGDLTDKGSTSMKFGGKTYHQTSKTGKSAHDGTPVTAYEHEESGHRVWGDAKGRVHADSTDEVGKLRAAGAKSGGAENGPGPAKAPAVKSKNEGFGFHGEAHNDHLRAKYGSDDYHQKASQQDRDDADVVAGRHFAAAADKLVSGGHFESHDKAGEYLDSRHGRHLHDAASAHGGDVSKVPWLKRDVAQFKKTGGKPF